MKRIFQLLLLGFLMVSALLPTQAAPKKSLWERWTQSDAKSKLKIDHRPWQNFLKEYVKTNTQGINLISYKDVTQESRNQLSDYISELQQIPINQYKRADQLAFWINLYNAETVKIVLDRYPVTSIRRINTSGLFSSGPWGAKSIFVMGVPLSLNDIEHRILRPIWNDPRIHYALSCGSIGCPNLQKTAFTAQNAPELMTQGAQQFINSPRALQINNHELYVSKLYEWYKEDFGGNAQGIIQHLSQYANPKLKQQLQSFNRINGTFFDWDLNAA